jgi:hypothetical protein
MLVAISYEDDFLSVAFGCSQLVYNRVGVHFLEITDINVQYVTVMR